MVGAFYYLRIVKLMYFDEPVETLDRPLGVSAASIMAVTAIAILLFFLVPGPLVESAGTAAASLFPG